MDRITAFRTTLVVGNKMSHIIAFDGFQVIAGDEWFDTTENFDAPSKPFTMTKQNGVGALQFSPALYVSGPRPSPTKDDLLSMAIELGHSRGIDEAQDIETFEDGLVGAGVTFREGGDFVQVWYLSQGGNFMLATYLCEWGLQHQELQECEEIVRTVQYEPFQAQKDE
jgi:hypothetical protein